MKHTSISVSILFFSVGILCGSIPQTELDSLLKTYAPEVRFHKDEQYFPSSVNWYGERCSLKKREGGKIIQVLPRPIKDINVLARYPTKDYPKGFNQINDYFLDPDNNEETQKGMPLVNKVCKAPCYAHVKEKGNGKIIIDYIFFYPHQGRTIGPKKVLKWKLDIGYHEGDWEHISVHLEKQNNKYVMTQVYYAAHGSKPHGELLYAADVSKVQGIHPIVYAAKYGHASHSSNIGFDTNTLDSTSDGGAVWRCWESGVINVGDREKPAPGQEWILFGGRWGSTKENTDALITTELNNSPSGPAIDSAWWRHSGSQTEHLATIAAKPVSGKASDYFTLKGRIPTRVRTLRWNIDHPQRDDIELVINEYRYLQGDRKNLYGTIYNGKVTQISQFQKNLYVADVRSKSGKKINGNLKVSVEAIEE